MSRPVRTVTRTTRRSRGRARLVALVCIPLIGLLVATLLVPDRKHPIPSPATAVAPNPDRQNAASAAVAFAQELAVTGVKSRDVYAKRLGTIAAPGSEPAVRATFERGAEEVRRVVGVSGLLRAVPLGYRV